MPGQQLSIQEPLSSSVMYVEQQYFSDSPVAHDDELHLLEVTSRGFDLQMWVSDQVFSGSKLDLGTRQLLAVAPDLPSEGRFVDLGCGWGPIAVSMGLESPQAEVWAVDVNSRALALTERNAQVNGTANVRPMKADEALAQAQTDGVRFDVIWSNPPIRIGKEALHAMLTSWLSLLSEDGRAYLVVQKNLGADSLISWLNAQGWPSAKIASKKGYRIIEVRSGSEAHPHDL